MKKKTKKPKAVRFYALADDCGVWTQTCVAGTDWFHITTCEQDAIDSCSVGESVVAFDAVPVPKKRRGKP